jgi:NCS1 nucleoside transporter family
MSTLTPPVPFPDTEREFYGQKVVAVEPGGVEFIPLDERHGSPTQLLWTWTSPNMEFATIAVGILGVLYFGLTFWQAVLAIVIGTLAGAVAQGVLSTWGPRDGLCQMVLSRTGFGFLGNILPSGLNAIVAGVGWFAVNSISGALALHTLIHSLPKQLCLVIIVVLELGIAFFGHNLVHVVERFAFPVLTIIFVIAAIWVLTKAHPGGFSTPGTSFPTGGFLIMTGATFGYAAGWNPYASDYTRYLKPDTKSLPVALSAGFGVFASCVLLEIAGAAAITALSAKGLNSALDSGPDPGQVTGLFPKWMADLTLIAIFIGAICANVLNIYSAGLSALTVGLKLPTTLARAAVSIGLGVVGYIVATQYVDNPSKYENFLLIISYWIGPWLAVVFLDRWFRRGSSNIVAITQDKSYTNWAGPIAMAVGSAISIWLFANQPPKYTGLIPTDHPAFGDITFEAGFVIAFVLYLVLHPILKPSTEATDASGAPVAESTTASR